MHNQFCLEYNSVIDDMSILITRIVDSLEKTKPSEYKKKQSWFRRMLDDSAETLEEALQRILFLGQLLWQTGSRLVGFGRLDVLREHTTGNLRYISVLTASLVVCG